MVSRLFAKKLINPKHWFMLLSHRSLLEIMEKFFFFFLLHDVCDFQQWYQSHLQNDKSRLWIKRILVRINKISSIMWICLNIISYMHVIWLRFWINQYIYDIYSDSFCVNIVEFNGLGFWNSSRIMFVNMIEFFWIRFWIEWN